MWRDLPQTRQLLDNLIAGGKLCFQAQDSRDSKPGKSGRHIGRYSEWSGTSKNARRTGKGDGGPPSLCHSSQIFHPKELFIDDDDDHDHDDDD